MRPLSKVWSRRARAMAYGLPPPAHSVAQRDLNTCAVGPGGRDILRATLMYPKDQPDGPWPVVLMRTPYGRHVDFGQATLAERGYAVLIQDTRGRFGSDGQFVPVQVRGVTTRSPLIGPSPQSSPSSSPLSPSLYHMNHTQTEREDGAATIAWLKEQPW